jgi:hypothetical protein
MSVDILRPKVAWLDFRPGNLTFFNAVISEILRANVLRWNTLFSYEEKYYSTTINPDNNARGKFHERR